MVFARLLGKMWAQRHCPTVSFSIWCSSGWKGFSVFSRLSAALVCSKALWPVRPLHHRTEVYTAAFNQTCSLGTCATHLRDDGELKTLPVDCAAANTKQHEESSSVSSEQHLGTLP